MIDAGELLEWATVHGTHRYGTPRGPVEEQLAAGTPALLELDLQGARQVRLTMPNAIFVFIEPPTMDELVRRLEHRGTESAAERSVRLETAQVEMAAAAEFDVRIVNDQLEQAVTELEKVVLNEAA